MTVAKKRCAMGWPPFICTGKQDDSGGLFNTVKCDRMVEEVSTVWKIIWMMASGLFWRVSIVNNFNYGQRIRNSGMQSTVRSNAEHRY